ncbi:hypothetical protein GA0115246_114545, partial [Streptomyces sp. SolWspMP-sol7th]
CRLAAQAPDGGDDAAGEETPELVGASGRR